MSNGQDSILTCIFLFEKEQAPFVLTALVCVCVRFFPVEVGIKRPTCPASCCLRTLFQSLPHKCSPLLSLDFRVTFK